MIRWKNKLVPPGEKVSCVSILAAHPYLCAFLICLFLNFFYYGDAETLRGYGFLIIGFLFFDWGAYKLYRFFGNHALNWRSILTHLLLTAAFFILEWQYVDRNLPWLGFLVGVVAVLWFLWLVYKPECKDRCIALLILGVGFALKVIYVAYTSILTRQHDVRRFDGDYTGHAGYIRYLLDFHHLPDFDPSTHWQLYHPPLHHAISAVWIWLQETLFGVSAEMAQESLQTLTLFYTMAILIACYQILRHFRLEGWSLWIPLTIFSFHPALILFSGSINNDVLSVAFVMGAFYCTMHWYRKQSLWNLLKIALCVGLGMMTKISAASVAIPIAAVFLFVFYQKMRQRQWKIFAHYGVFLAVCAPLGLWYPIRNYVMFNLPLNYVQKMSNSSVQYLGDRSFWSRITDFSLGQFQSVFELFAKRDDDGVIVGQNDFNPLVAAMKNSVFGEFINTNRIPGDSWCHTFAVLLFWVNVLLAAVCFCAMIRWLFLHHTLEKWFSIGYYAVLMYSYYALSYTSPFVCSMNSRYIIPAIFIPTIALGMLLQHEFAATSLLPRQKFKKYGLTVLSGGITVIFCLLVTVVYLFVLGT